MGELAELKNISEVTERLLNRAGIHTVEGLRAIGAEDAFLLVHKIEPNIGVQMLYALKGAIEGVRWCDLDEDIRKECKETYLRIEEDEYED